MSELRLDALVRPRFSGDGWFYRGLSLSLAAGRVMTIVGPNGAGKSTLLRDVAGLTAPIGGRVQLGGTDLATVPPRARARLLAYLPQHHDFPHDLPVHDVVALGRAPRRGLFGALSADDRGAIDRALDATDTMHLRDRGILRLSGGERQRVMLARMLATETDTLILDEPTTALDVGHALALLGRLRGLADSGRTVVFSAHDLDHARRVADDALVLRDDADGSFEFGPAAEVLVPAVLDDVFNVRSSVDERGLWFETR